MAQWQGAESSGARGIQLTPSRSSRCRDAGRSRAPARVRRIRRAVARDAGRALVGPGLYTVDDQPRQWRYFSFHVGSVIRTPVRRLGPRVPPLPDHRQRCASSWAGGIVDLGEVAFAE